MWLSCACLRSALSIEITKDVETQIKIEICEIFEYILDWREDFFIQNAMNYFTDHFYETNKDADLYMKQPEEVDKELCDLMPESMFGVGMPVLPKKKKFKMFETKHKKDSNNQPFITDP